MERMLLVNASLCGLMALSTIYLSRGKQRHEKKQPRRQFLTANSRTLLKQLLVVNLFLQLLEGWLAYDVSVQSWAGKYSIFSEAQMTDAALHTLICNKALTCMLLLSIVWLGNKRPRLATQAMIVTAAVSAVFFADHVQRLLG